ncbi:MAG: GNAT family N-acetyltransferase [Clostridiales bacterium]|nr:GNAT family N-acetyltransferase [Clostridiales bacterium]
MIKLIQSNTEFDFDFCDSLFMAKILCIYNTYGFKSYTDYWAQNKNAVIARLDDCYVIWHNENADKEELKSFIKTVCNGTVLCGEGLLDDYNLSGHVMKYNSGVNTQTEALQPVDDNEILKVYQLLKRCENESLNVPEYLHFKADVVHKLNSDTLKLAYTQKDNDIVSVAAANIGGDSAVITAVATDKEYRRLGFGTDTVKRLLSFINCKNIYLQRTLNDNEEFYNSLGFINTAKWFCKIN